MKGTATTSMSSGRPAHDVEIVEILPHAFEDLVAVDHFQHQLDPGMLAAEFADDLGREIPRRGDHRQPQAAALQALHFGQLHAQKLQPLEHVAAGGRGGASRIGQEKFFSGLLMQRQPQAFRELLDLHGKGRGRHVHFFRRPRHVHVARESGHEAQLMERHPPQHCLLQ